MLEADQILVGDNRTRSLYNQRIRQLKGSQSRCRRRRQAGLLRNNRVKGLINGGLWRVETLSACARTSFA